MYFPSVCADSEYVYCYADKPMISVNEFLAQHEDWQDIYTAMETFLSGVYIQVDHSRYTYSGGSTTGGAVIYDNGLFLYSHHASDPCCGKLVNSFDMVRIHKFGETDDQAAANTPVNKLPSYQMMCELAASDPKVLKQLAKERAESAILNSNSISRRD